MHAGLRSDNWALVRNQGIQSHVSVMSLRTSHCICNCFVRERLTAALWENAAFSSFAFIYSDGERTSMCHMASHIGVFCVVEKFALLLRFPVTSRSQYHPLVQRALFLPLSAVPGSDVTSETLLSVVSETITQLLETALSQRALRF
uniref:Uncharacterized protein n=1 Tax=Steinernema glaseri TaxID=37863 RepID=A0A1I8AN37_9BILA